MNTNDCYAVRSKCKQDITKQAIALVSKLSKGERVEQELIAMIRKLASIGA